MGLREVAFRDGMTEGDRSVFRPPVTVGYWWVCACLVFHRYAYSPLVTEPNDYGKSVCLDGSGPQRSIL